VPYIQARQSGRVEYRRVFPKELRPYVGATELVRTLKAKSVTEPAAVELLRAANEEYDRRVALARKAASGQFDELDGPKAAWLVESYYAAQLAKDDARRMRGETDAEMHEAADDGLRETLANGDVRHIVEMFEEDVAALAAPQHWRFDKASEPFARLCVELLRAHIRANEMAMARDAGAPVETPQIGTPPRRPSGSSRPTGPSFDAIARAEMGRPTFGAGASTKQMWNTALGYFREVHGDLPPEKITRSHATRLADLLALAPAKRTKAERKLPLPKIVDAYRGKDIMRLAHKTRGAILGALQAAWNRAQRSGEINDNLPNPFARPSLEKAPPPVENEGLLKPETLAIFALPVFTKGERPMGGRGEAAYWIPVLLLTTGARPEELAQLLVSDVQRHEETGEWTLTITDEGTHPHKRKRRLKAGKGRRTFPLPQIVTDLGFLEYVAWVRERGEAALFPGLRTKGQRDELYASFGDWWRKYLRANNAYPGGENRKGGRDFRHTWPTVARACGISTDAQQYIMGHIPPGAGMNARYGSRQPLAAEIHKLRFDGWGLDQVRRWEVPLE